MAMEKRFKLMEYILPCRAHIEKSVTEYLMQKGVVQAVIPGGLTAYVQAGDMGIYKSFKDKIGVLIES